jgi:hypothetical protein
MKNYKLLVRIFSLACICLVLVGAPGTILAKSGGHLIVNRVANFGDGLSLSVSVDGKEVARLGEGQNYDGYLPPGQHVVSAMVAPNLVGATTWRKTMSIKTGQTYSFTAIWQGQNVVLVKN